jgi:hypothetical protein
MSTATINTFAADLSETMGLNPSDVIDAIRTHRHLFSRYEDMSTEELEALSRAVWADVTHGAEWVWSTTCPR